MWNQDDMQAKRERTANSPWKVRTSNGSFNCYAIRCGCGVPKGIKVWRIEDGRMLSSKEWLGSEARDIIEVQSERKEATWSVGDGWLQRGKKEGNNAPAKLESERKTRS